MSDDPIDAAWAEVEASWDDDASHKRFLTLCASLGRLGDAGRRYREVREGDPERADRAKEQIDRLLGLAMQTLDAVKTEPTRRTGKTTLLLVALGVSGSIIFTALALLLRVM